MRGPAAAALAMLALLLPGAAAQVPLPPGPATPAYEYHSYTTLTRDLQALAAQRPDIARLTSIGTSALGLDLWSLELGNFSDPRYAELPGFYVDGAHHGNEWLGMEAAYTFAARLVQGHGTDANLTALVEAHRIVVVPLVNPDGNALDQRQNAHLVDLNRNYPFHWNERGTGQAGTPNYGGPSAGSEPEVQATMAHLDAVRPRVYVSFHTGTYDLVRPFGHAPGEPVPDEGVYQSLLGAVAADTGLEARWPGGSGESTDWAYGARGVFSVLPEVFEHAVRPEGTPQLLPGPLTDAEVAALLDPHLGVLFHLLEHTAHWGAHLEARLEGETATQGHLVLRNTGFGPAHNLSAAGTGITLRGALPDGIPPGGEARIPVTVEGPSQVRVAYQRLAIDTGDPSHTMASVVAELPIHTGPLEPRPAPLAPALVALALAGVLALALRRARR